MNKPIGQGNGTVVPVNAGEWRCSPTHS